MGDRMEEIIKYRHNHIEVNSLEGFARIRGGFHENSRDVYFVRMLGWSTELDRQIRRMDEELSKEMRAGRLYYRRIHSLPKLTAAEEVAYYVQCYERWKDAQQDGIRTKISGRQLARQLGAACREVLRLYQDGKTAVTESVKKNFAVKLLYWFDFVCSGLQQWNGRSCIKIVAENVGKEQEYLFYYFLTLAGCDALLLQSAADPVPDKIKRLSKEVCIGAFCPAGIPEFHALQPDASACDRINVRKGPAPRRENSACDRINVGKGSAPRREKTFEELAALASSIVLILVHGRDGEVVATGSGIMVGRAGYILTNDHVARGGYSYSVRIENEEQVYQTDELIKYNTVLDLALLRIQRRLDPLPIYRGDGKLVRGQKVAAIGSPLGLFNSVSDGIISGFCTIDGVDMIQFTAPISRGSSGGAVLNMYGEVIGISTAGFDRGQNINLAVGYESINMFIQGFQS